MQSKVMQHVLGHCLCSSPYRRGTWLLLVDRQAAVLLLSLHVCRQPSTCCAMYGASILKLQATAPDHRGSTFSCKQSVCIPLKGYQWHHIISTSSVSYLQESPIESSCILHQLLAPACSHMRCHRRRRQPPLHWICIRRHPQVAAQGTADQPP
jgi:hypothetical protein